MIVSLATDELIQYLTRQIDAAFPDGQKHNVGKAVTHALDRLEHCFSPIKLAGYRKGEGSYFSHLHSDQYAQFLYICSNVAWKDLEDMQLASKLFFLNKAMNGIVCMYDTVLPEHFVFAHTTGTMLGKATYGDYFVALHNVTVGTDHGIQPRFGQGAVLFAGSSVIGDCTIGASVSVAAGALILNTSIPSEHVVAGTSPDLIVKPAKRRVIEEFYHMAPSERLVINAHVSR